MDRIRNGRKIAYPSCNVHLDFHTPLFVKNVAAGLDCDDFENTERIIE